MSSSSNKSKTPVVNPHQCKCQLRIKGEHFHDNHGDKRCIYSACAPCCAHKCKVINASVQLDERVHCAVHTDTPRPARPRSDVNLSEASEDPSMANNDGETVDSDDEPEEEDAPDTEPADTAASTSGTSASDMFGLSSYQSSSSSSTASISDLRSVLRTMVQTEGKQGPQKPPSKAPNVGSHSSHLAPSPPSQPGSVQFGMSSLGTHAGPVADSDLRSFVALLTQSIAKLADKDRGLSRLTHVPSPAAMVDTNRIYQMLSNMQPEESLSNSILSELLCFGSVCTFVANYSWRRERNSNEALVLAQIIDSCLLASSNGKELPPLLLEIASRRIYGLLDADKHENWKACSDICLKPLNVLDQRMEKLRNRNKKSSSGQSISSASKSSTSRYRKGGFYGKAKSADQSSSTSSSSPSGTGSGQTGSSRQ